MDSPHKGTSNAESVYYLVFDGVYPGYPEEVYVMRVPELIKYVLIIEHGQTYPLTMVEYDIVGVLLEGPYAADYAKALFI